MPFQFAALSDTVALYHCGEATGASLTDSSGNGFTVAIAGAGIGYSDTGPLLTTAGALAKSRRTNSTPTYFQQATQQSVLQTTFLPGTSFTVDALFRPLAGTGFNDGTYGTLVSYAGNDGTANTNSMCTLYYNKTNGSINASWQDATHVEVAVLTSASSLISVETWYHATFVRTYTGSAYNSALYLNGSSVASATGTSAPTGGSSNKLAIGQWSGTASFIFGGNITEVRISNTAHSSTQVAADYQRLLGAPYWSPGAVATQIAAGVG